MFEQASKEIVVMNEIMESNDMNMSVKNRLNQLITTLKSTVFVYMIRHEMKEDRIMRKRFAIMKIY